MSIIWDLIRSSNRFDRIKNSDRAAKSYGFGVRCILCCVFGAALAAAGGFGLQLLNTTPKSAGGVEEAVGAVVQSCGNIILGAPILIIGALGALILWLFAIVNLRYQLKMNKRAIGYVCIFLVIASIIGGILGFAFLGHIF